MTRSDVPKTQTAAVLFGQYGDHHKIVHDYQITPPGPTEVVIKLEASGICHGDTHARDGGPPAPPTATRPLVPGHEGIGRIIITGARVQTFSVGDRVGTGWRRSTCHECLQCEEGRENHCPSLVVNGYLHNGTFQEYITIPASDLIPIPSTTRGAEELVPLLCAGATALAAVRTANVPHGQWICVTGAAGGVGSLAIQYAKHFGCKVIAIDKAEKKESCEKLGATFFPYDASNVIDCVVRASNGGTLATIVCSPSSSSYTQAFMWTGNGGTVVSVAPAMVNIHTGPMLAKGLKLVGQCNATRQDMRDALALSEEGIVPSVEVIKIDDVDIALDKLKIGAVSGRQVITFT